ncbi:hypothetical protein BDP55DRAFT_631766 [Colletotrichum godetiae]|uniref:Uncharacterized protein n=1 Tax=Colletotrichum godetiae TaxID=1209918 RepID=A0AAJ0ALG8_9PEZI|nr:uncharacterized protein BDP55DRAFT_631766 [Colletotrichum godetiae]KAK1676077.1 hypothetical protein BDP55DRAFT_631766 [Colletotrichum godetiae]
MVGENETTPDSQPLHLSGVLSGTPSQSQWHGRKPEPLTIPTGKNLRNILQQSIALHEREGEGTKNMNRGQARTNHQRFELYLRRWSETSPLSRAEDCMLQRLNYSHFNSIGRVLGPKGIREAGLNFEVIQSCTLNARSFGNGETASLSLHSETKIQDHDPDAPARPRRRESTYTIKTSLSGQLMQ